MPGAILALGRMVRLFPNLCFDHMEIRQVTVYKINNSIKIGYNRCPAIWKKKKKIKKKKERK